jgi:hypothetical protein
MVDATEAIVLVLENENPIIVFDLIAHKCFFVKEFEESMSTNPLMTCKYA